MTDVKITYIYGIYNLKIFKNLTLNIKHRVSFLVNLDMNHYERFQSLL